MWINKKFSYLPLEEALQLIRENIRPRRIETIPIFEGYNRVLAEDIISDVNIPENNVSYVDGYAIKSKDTLSANTVPLRLKVVGKIYPNSKHKVDINDGEAVYVSTGCELPPSADAIIPVEQVKELGGFIQIQRVIKPYEHAILAGSDIKKGDTILRAGQVLRAQDIKLLADIKRLSIKVFTKPIVALLSVGSELTDQIEESNEKKFASHTLMLSMLIKEIGGIPIDFGVAIDDVENIKRNLKRGLSEADILVTIGGASIGDKDYVLEAIKQLGGKIIFRGIKVQPSRVTTMAIIDDKPIIMLPGHIQSTFVGFLLALLPAIQLLRGVIAPHRFLTFKARIAQEIVVKEYPSFKRVRFVNIIKHGDEYVAEPLLGDSSLISILTKANGFTIIHEGKDIIEKGELVDVYYLNDLTPYISVQEA